MKKYFLPISVTILISLHSKLYAQQATTKDDEKKKEALAIRYQTDKGYASSQRGLANGNLNYWIGYKISDLIAKWGAPSRTVSDGADGQIVVYENFISGTTGGYTPGYMTWDEWGGITSYTPAQDTRSSYSYTKYWEIYTDKNGIITKLNNGTR